MKYNQTLIKRADFIINHGHDSISFGEENEYGNIIGQTTKWRSFRSSGLSFILDLYGKEHPYYTEFKNVTKYQYESNLYSGIEIINNIKAEIENGWILTIKSLVSAEIFNDFLEMAEHLLNNDYKDASAVIIGGVLEEHLRQLCIEKGISIEYEKDGKILPFKADRMNSELAKAGIYNKIEQKNVTAHLGLRNNAAHGNYSEYDRKQVEIMYDYVMNFITKYQLS